MTTRTIHAPTTIAEAKSRKRQLEVDIADIGCQLSAKHRKARGGGRLLSAEEYQHWRARTRHVLMRKEAEQRHLKDWIVARRRELTARRLDIDDANDPLDIIVAVRTELAAAEPRLGLLVECLEQYLAHVA